VSAAIGHLAASVCCDDTTDCGAVVTAPTLILATAQATRDGWETRPAVTVLDGVPRQRVEHYCPAHAGGAS